MEEIEIRYALSKQVHSLESLNTSYGELLLDDEMKDAIKTTLVKLLEQKLAEIERN